MPPVSRNADEAGREMDRAAAEIRARGYSVMGSSMAVRAIAEWKRRERAKRGLNA